MVYSEYSGCVLGVRTEVDVYCALQYKRFPGRFKNIEPKQMWEIDPAFYLNRSPEFYPIHSFVLDNCMSTMTQQFHASNAQVKSPLLKHTQKVI